MANCGHSTRALSALCVPRLMMGFLLTPAVALAGTATFTLVGADARVERGASVERSFVTTQHLAGHTAAPWKSRKGAGSKRSDAHAREPVSAWLPSGRSSAPQALRGSMEASWHAGSQRMAANYSAAYIEPNDFWGLRDLLLISYAGVFMQQGSVGHQLVQAYALDLAGMLPLIHPYEPCRESIGWILDNSPAGQYASDPDNKARLESVAEAAWSCLPARFTTASFSNPYTTEMMGDFSTSFDAHMTVPLDKSSLGSCAASLWPRTCSYWATVHAMAKRADAIGVGDRFVRAFVSMAAAGATMCAGCTLHWHALHKDFLDPRILQGFGRSF